MRDSVYDNEDNLEKETDNQEVSERVRFCRKKLFPVLRMIDEVLYDLGYVDLYSGVELCNAIRQLQEVRNTLREYFQRYYADEVKQ